MTLDKVLEFYCNSFVPIYADFVALSAIKPEQVLIEESNILSHLTQYLNNDISDDLQKENLSKAHNHLIRATLDLHKMVWAEIKYQLEPFIFDEKKRLAFSVSESDVYQRYTQFIELAREARRFEAQNIGNNPLETIKKYEAVNTIGYTLLNKIDEFKAARVKKWNYMFSTKEFIFGVLSSLTATAFVYGLIKLIQSL